MGGALARRWLRGDTGVFGSAGVGSECVLAVVSGPCTPSFVKTGVFRRDAEKALGWIGLSALVPLYVTCGLEGGFGESAEAFEPREARGELDARESCELER